MPSGADWGYSAPARDLLLLTCINLPAETLERQLVDQMSYLDSDGGVKLDHGGAALGPALFDETEHAVAVNSLGVNALRLGESDEELQELSELAPSTSDSAVCVDWHDSGLVSPSIMASGKPSD